MNVEGLLSLWASPVPGCRGHRLTGSWGWGKYTLVLCAYAVNYTILAELLNLCEDSQLERTTCYLCVRVGLQVWGMGEVKKKLAFV